MDTPLQLTFRHVDASHAVETRVKELATKLERVHGRLTRCFVLIEGPSEHHNKGGPYSVRIELGVPRRDIVAQDAHPDVYLAVSRAFEHAQRQLLESVQTG